LGNEAYGPGSSGGGDEGIGMDVGDGEATGDGIAENEGDSEGRADNPAGSVLGPSAGTTDVSLDVGMSTSNSGGLTDLSYGPGPAASISPSDLPPDLVSASLSLSSHSSNSATPAVPTMASEWFKMGFGEVTKTNLGPLFQEILCHFIEIETTSDFADGKKGFSKAGRPDELGKWIAAGCWRRTPPVITNVKNFTNIWWKWWIGLQPEWREELEGGRLARAMYGNDWETLTLPGPNGWLSVVACLYWWGCAVRESTTNLVAEYEDALHDVIFMMQGLVEHLKAQSG
jgi:hypothetical protein